jgi:hypothetical protein
LIATRMLAQVVALGTMKVENDYDLLPRFQTSQAFRQGWVEDEPGLDST